MEIKEFVTEKLEESKVRLDLARERLIAKEEKGENLRNTQDSMAWNEGKIKAYKTVLGELEAKSV